MLNTEYTKDIIVCPHCGYEHKEDLYEIHHGQEDFEAWCHSCEEEFYGTMNISISYSTHTGGE